MQCWIILLVYIITLYRLLLAVVLDMDARKWGYTHQKEEEEEKEKGEKKERYPIKNTRRETMDEW
jgi:hypothetical protein